MARVPVVKSTQEYLLLLAGDVALKLVRTALKDHSSSDIPKDPFKENIYLSVEGDGRIANRVYETLKEQGALTSYTSWRPEDPFNSYNCYRRTPRKEPKRYSGTVSETWFNTFAQANAIAPKFETSGLITKKKYSYSTETERVLKTEFQNYRKIGSYQEFTDAECLYIWLHLNEYDVQTLVEKHNGIPRASDFPSS